MIDLFYMQELPVAVMGLGKSGLATARALRDSGAEVRVWDDNPASRAAAEAEGSVSFPVATSICPIVAATSMRVTSSDGSKARPAGTVNSLMYGDAASTSA